MKRVGSNLELQGSPKGIAEGNPRIFAKPVGFMQALQGSPVRGIMTDRSDVIIPFIFKYVDYYSLN